MLKVCIMNYVSTVCWDDCVQCILDKIREAEFQVAPMEDILFDIRHGVQASPVRPKCLKLIKTIKLPDTAISICNYKDKTFLGLSNSQIVAIDKDFQIRDVFTCSGTPESICVYKDHFYLLICGDPSKVRVYNHSGKLLTKWSHYDSNAGGYTDGLAVIGDEVLIADRTKHRISVYSLTGKELRQMPTFLLGQKRKVVSFCAVDESSLIITDHNCSKVCKMNATTGVKIWESDYVTNPKSAACPMGRYIMVATSKGIQLLDMDGSFVFYYILSVFLTK